MGIEPPAAKPSAVVGKCRWLRFAGIVAVVGMAAGVGIATLRPRPAAPEIPALPTRLPQRAFAPRDPLFDENGYSTVLLYMQPGKAGAGQRISDAFQAAGRRGRQQLEEQLARNPPAGRRMELLVRLAQLHLYEGLYAKAAEVLHEARQLMADRPDQHGTAYGTVLFLQGIAALRQAETENCIECQCEGSCLFPLQPQAVHQKKAGARAAAQFFAEYLAEYPNDLAVRWLLTIAAMTLGEFPERVPERLRIDLNSFNSEFDIGRFRDVAPQLGVNRFAQSGGAILDDFDNDGLLDLVQTCWEDGVPLAFYRNRGDGTFEDRTKAAKLDQQTGGLYCVQTDYNNDGHLDIFVARGAWRSIPQRQSLLRNNGDGTFTDVTVQAGLDAPIDTQVAAWADYDNDGFLDLYVGGESVPSRLYHNRGDGTFEEVAARAGVTNEGFRCKGACWGDYDGDGRPDLLVVNNLGPPRLYHNNGNGTFTDVAPQLGITRPGYAFSCWFFDYDNDGFPDIFIAGYRLDAALDDVILSQLGLPHQGETCRLYHNRGGKGFEDVTHAAGLDHVYCPMGSNFFDADNDGYLDFYLGTGNPKYSVLVPNRLFKNVKGQRFADITTSSGTGHLQKGHAVACGDWDRDGNVDLFVQIGGATPGDRFRSALFQNPGHAHHWISVKLVGRKTNRAAIGASVKLTLPGNDPPQIVREINSGSSFGANPLQQTIGLGPATTIATLEVRWPTSKTVQIFHDVPVDGAIEITEFEKSYRRLPWSPMASMTLGEAPAASGKA